MCVFSCLRVWTQHRPKTNLNAFSHECILSKIGYSHLETLLLETVLESSFYHNKVSQIWDRNSSNDPCFLLSMPLCRPCAHWICAGLMTHCNKQMHQSYYCGSSETKHEDLCFFSAYAFVRHQVRWTASLRDH